MATESLFLQIKSYHISISHSNLLTSIILSHKHRVGLDLEYVSNKIARLAGKFLTPPEEKAISTPGSKGTMYIFTGAQKRHYIRYVTSRILIFVKR
jgi:phosphopantetheinyl transferase